MFYFAKLTLLSNLLLSLVMITQTFHGIFHGYGVNSHVKPVALKVSNRSTRRFPTFSSLDGAADGYGGVMGATSWYIMVSEGM